jgi:hypothetical protein
LKDKNSCFGLENREYGHRDLLCWPRNTLYQQKLGLTWPTNGCHSRIKATEFDCQVVEYTVWNDMFVDLTAAHVAKRMLSASG